jgi:shikimate kinase
MPGSGKSTVGVILARLTGLRFVDTDLEIQVREQATLQAILERDGYRRLRAIEQEVLLATKLEQAVIATGGSVVYSELVMDRLKSAGVVVYLEAGLVCLQQRVDLAPPRGIASDARQSYAEIFAERTPLYQQYADITLATDEVCAERVAARILEQLQPLA